LENRRNGIACHSSCFPSLFVYFSVQTAWAFNLFAPSLLVCDSVSFKGTTTGDFSNQSLTWSQHRGNFLDVSDPDGSQIHQVLVGLARLSWRN
jgi:hypothetical protein